MAERIVHVPTTLFTGFFGVGKTTAIKSLLSRKPASENWAILVNEFGEVAVDQAAISPGDGDPSVTIKEIPGGCLCCVMNVPMRVAIIDILRRARPDRLLIEPTGIGHPAGILDQLQSEDLAEAVSVKAVICLVDPRHVGDPRLEGVEVFQDQVHLADVLVAGKADLASADELANYHQWAGSMFPPKLLVTEARQGDLDLALLDLDPALVRAPLFPHLHDHAQPAEPPSADPAPAPGKPVRRENVGVGYQACGWIFSPEDNFESGALLDLLGPPGLPGVAKGAPVERLKGVFRSQNNWRLIDRVDNEVTVKEIAHRRDSRLEVILPEGVVVDWDELEAALLATIG